MKQPLPRTIDGEGCVEVKVGLLSDREIFS